MSDIDLVREVHKDIEEIDLKTVVDIDRRNESDQDRVLKNDIVIEEVDLEKGIDQDLKKDTVDEDRQETDQEIDQGIDHYQVIRNVEKEVDLEKRLKNRKLVKSMMLKWRTSAKV